MAVKITKAQYTKRMAALVAKLEHAKSEVQIMCELFDEAAPHSITMELSDFGNSFHDAVYDVEQEIKALEFEWNTRHFTGSDWNSYELVTSNID